MALYWPEQKVALEIVDDPLAQPFDEKTHPGWSVLRVTMAQVNDLEGSREIGDKLRVMMGMKPIQRTPEWLRKNEELHYALRAWSDQYYR